MDAGPDPEHVTEWLAAWRHGDAQAGDMSTC
jgi:hypothetical protein